MVITLFKRQSKVEFLRDGIACLYISIPAVPTDPPFSDGWFLLPAVCLQNHCRVMLIGYRKNTNECLFQKGFVLIWTDCYINPHGRSCQRCWCSCSGIWIFFLRIACFTKRWPASAVCRNDCHNANLVLRLLALNLYDHLCVPYLAPQDCNTGNSDIWSTQGKESRKQVQCILTRAC